jgi:ribosomal protein L34
MHPILLLIIVIAVLLTVSWLKRQPAAQRKKMGFRAAMAAAAGILLIALLTGKLSPLVALVAAAIPVMQRLMVAKSLFDRIKSMGGPSPGRTSGVSTRYLDMSLDHDTGEMQGRVREGPFAGRSLDQLTLDELLSLLAVCRREDAQSAAVLEAWLDRAHGGEWRDRDRAGSGEPHRGRERMSTEEARQVLGVVAGAGRDEVIQAHRRLMQKLHPDRGGSAYLAAKLNQAKDVLLDEP